MSKRAPPLERGFTLVEMIIAMVITGIVAGIVAVFMVSPIQAYFDSTRRAAMTDAADTALRRIGYELRGAVPNTARVAGGNSFLEFVPAQDGGRYRLQTSALGAGDPLDGTTTGDTSFQVLGPNVTSAAGNYVVVFNTGQPGLSVYENCGAAAATNCRTLSANAGANVSFNNATNFPPFDSPTQRFQLVPATGAITFGCTGVGSAGGNGTGVLRRYTGYPWFNAATPAVAGLGAGDILANFVSTCAFSYAPVNQANGLVTLRLTIQRENEAVTLVHQVHVDNTP